MGRRGMMGRITGSLGLNGMLHERNARIKMKSDALEVTEKGTRQGVREKFMNQGVGEEFCRQ